MPDLRTVLVVDDSHSVAKQLSRLLEESGRYKVLAHAGDGVEALKKYTELKPSLVCMDVAMPTMDGLQALRLIRHVDPEARVVMISSVGGVADKVTECLKLGAKSVVSKPFDAKRVLEILDGIA